MKPWILAGLLAGSCFAHDLFWKPSPPGEHTFGSHPAEAPPTALAFRSLTNEVGISWDDRWLYVESDGIPSHPMMKGITAWQQQVPIPHDFTGKQAFRIPLQPRRLDEPGELTLIGPLAVAVNGIPIFHALTQSGKDAYAGGELDDWGGHCGRADDYHYHIAPAHLEKVVGEGNPVAFALDGYPIVIDDPDREKPLDDCHGFVGEDGRYRYVGTLEPPYVMSGFRGAVNLEDRPRTRGVRPFLRPLRGAEITGFAGSLAEGFRLTYALGDRDYHLEYTVLPDSMTLTRIDPSGRRTTETHRRRADDGRRPRPDGRRPPRRP